MKFFESLFAGNFNDNPLPPFSVSQATFYKDYAGEKAHYHTISEKMYLVLRGLGILVVDGKEIEMKPIGHSHYAGETGELFTDLSTLSTALKIANTITLTVK